MEREAPIAFRRDNGGRFPSAGSGGGGGGGDAPFYALSPNNGHVLW